MSIISFQFNISEWAFGLNEIFLSYIRDEKIIIETYVTLEYRINGYIGITVLSMEFLQNHKSPGHNNCPNCDI